MPRILLCDDHKLFVEGIGEKLKHLEFECNFVTSSKEFKNEVEHCFYDIILCDINIAGINGFDLLQEFRSRLIGSRIYILSGYQEQYLIEKAQKMNLEGFLFKDISIDKLLEVLRLEKGHEFIYPDFIKGYSMIPEPIKEIQPKAFILSKQEKKIIQLICEGLTSQEIGNRLFISKHTVDTHRRNILRKLDLCSTVALINFAHENVILD